MNIKDLIKDASQSKTQQIDRIKQNLITLISGGGKEQEEAATKIAAEIAKLNCLVSALINLVEENNED